MVPRRPSGLCTRKTGRLSDVAVLPYAWNGDNEGLSAIKGAVDIESGMPISPRPSSRTRAIVLAVLNGLWLATTPIARAWALGIPCSAALYVVGALSLNGVRPFTSVELYSEFPASLGGAAAAAPATLGALALADIILRGLRPKEDESIVEHLNRMAGIAGLLSSVFAAPLGFAIMSWFVPETFDVWHAVVVTAAGLGVVVGQLIFALILALVIVLLWVREGP